MEEYLKNRMDKIMQEYNNKLLQQVGLEDQLKTCNTQIEQLRGAYSELESALSASKQ